LALFPVKTWTVKISSAIANVNAVVVLPVGRKANWSPRRHFGKLGKRCHLTNNRSKTRDLGVADIGLRSEYEDGRVILGIGVTI
jgi:hypothetical protein